MRRRRYIYPIPLAITVALWWPMRSLAPQYLLTQGLLWYSIFYGVMLKWRIAHDKNIENQHRYSLGYLAIPVPQVPMPWRPPSTAKARTQQEELALAAALSVLLMARCFISAILPRSTQAMVVLVILTVGPGLVRVILHALRWRITRGKDPIVAMFPTRTYRFLWASPLIGCFLPTQQPSRRVPGRRALHGADSPVD